jgi:DNA-binding beta-propeller fold protein YncE
VRGEMKSLVPMSRLPSPSSASRTTSRSVVTLVEKLGLAANLEDKARAERDGDGRGSTAAPGARTAPVFRPAGRPRTKLWIVGIVAFFAIPPLIWVPVSIVLGQHQQQADHVKADRERQFALPFTNLRVPHGVAVDAAGNVYVADGRTNRVLKLAAGSNTQTVLPSMGRWVTPHNLAVDASGTVYASVDVSCGKHVCSYVMRLSPGSNTWTRLPSAGNEEYVAADTAGNVYVITLGDTGGVMRLAPGSSDWTQLPGAHRFVDPQGLAVDNHGNVYVTDHTGSRQPDSLFGIWPVGNDNAQGFVLKLSTG